MKTFLSLFFALCIFTAEAQNKDATPAKATTQALTARQPSEQSAAPTPPTVYSEGYYYQKMYELAKEKAEQSHTDTQWGYGINATIVVAIVAIILAVQIFSNKAESNFLRETVRNDVARQLEESQRVVLEALSARHAENLEALRNSNTENLRTLEARGDAIESRIAVRVNQDLENIKFQDYVNRVNLANYNYTSPPPTQSAEYNNLTEEDKRKAFNLISNSYERTKEVIIVIERGGEGVVELIESLIELVRNQKFTTTSCLHKLVDLRSIISRKEEYKHLEAPLQEALESLVRI